MPLIAIDRYRDYLDGLLEAQPTGLIERLRGKNLACFCPLDQPCHADVLLEIANSGGDAEMRDDRWGIGATR